jgi:dTDP-glucose 4,6-dehydratase
MDTAKTILITGGAGFIGSNFVKYWFNTYPDDNIIVLDALTYAGNPQNFPAYIKESDRFEFWYGNITNDELVNALVEKADIVIHFAAESHVARSIFDNKIFYMTDVIGTQVLANAVLKHYKQIERFIHISTSEVYGTALTNPMTEEHPLNPMSPYASAKAGADRLVYSYWATYDIPAIIVRPFNQYGLQQHLEKVIPRFITSAIKNEPLTIHGDGSARRDWLHVLDTCERLEIIVNAPLAKVKGQVFNIGSGYDLDVLSIAKMIINATDRSTNLISYIGDRLGQVQHHISSTEKSYKILGIKPGRSFEAGILETIKWYEENQNWWKPLEWMKDVKILTKSGKVERH